MRAEFERKLLADPDAAARITLVDGDAASFSLERPSPWPDGGVFEHLLTPRPGWRRANIARHLEPGGLLVFDIFLARSGRRAAHPRRPGQPGQARISPLLATRQHGPSLGETLLRYEVYQDGQRLQRVNSASAWPSPRWRRSKTCWLRAGLAVRLTFRDYQFLPTCPAIRCWWWTRCASADRPAPEAWFFSFTQEVAMWQEFKKFLAQGNVIDLAVAVIMGTAFGAVVTSLVEDVIMPPIGLLLGGVDFSNLFINLSGTPYASLAARLRPPARLPSTTACSSAQ